MFSVVCVLLPISDTPAAGAIRTSLAPFQRGDRLAFGDETDALHAIHDATLTLTLSKDAGSRIEGGGNGVVWLLDTRAVCDAMNERGRDPWQVRCADTLTLDAFASAMGSAASNATLRRAAGAGRWRRGCTERHRDESRGKAQAEEGGTPKGGLIGIPA